MNFKKIMSDTEKINRK